MRSHTGKAVRTRQLPVDGDGGGILIDYRVRLAEITVLEDRRHRIGHSEKFIDDDLTEPLRRVRRCGAV